VCVCVRVRARAEHCYDVLLNLLFRMLITGQMHYRCAGIYNLNVEVCSDSILGFACVVVAVVG
jgi:hypothetical protein